MICVGVYCNDITHSWLQFVTVIKHGVHCKGANRTVSVETDNLQSLCLILHACIHLSVWCHDSLQVMLKFQVHILETVNLKEIMDSSQPYLEAFLQSNGSLLKPLHNNDRIIFLFWFSKCCQLVKVLFRSFSSIWVNNFLDISILQTRKNFSWKNFTG